VGGRSGDGAHTSSYSRSNIRVPGLVGQHAHFANFRARDRESGGSKGAAFLYLADHVILGRALKDTVIGPLCLHYDTVTVLKVLYRSPISSLSLQARCNRKQSKCRGNSSEPVSRVHSCVWSPCNESKNDLAEIYYSVTIARRCGERICGRGNEDIKVGRAHRISVTGKT
jgi:hypothetical protein